MKSSGMSVSAVDVINTLEYNGLFTVNESWIRTVVLYSRIVLDDLVMRVNILAMGYGGGYEVDF